VAVRGKGTARAGVEDGRKRVTRQDSSACREAQG